MVHVAADPPTVCAAYGRRIDHPTSCVEVMMTAPTTGAGKGVASGMGATARTTQSGKPAYEKPENVVGQAGTSNVPPMPNPLQAAIEKLVVLVVPSADLALTQAQLEEQRQHILREATEVARVQQEFDISLREYNTAHGLTPVADMPSCIDDMRNQGRNLNAEVDRDGRSRSSVSATLMSANRPKYSSPAKNLRAAQAAVAELPSFSGEALRKQQARVHELLDVANRQNTEFKKANLGAGASQVIHSARGAGRKSVGQASSPHVGGKHDGSVNSKQITLYELVLAGKQIAGRGN